MRMHAKYNNNIIHINLLIVYAYIGLLPMGIGEAQWPLPDEDEGDHPSIEARRGIETRKAINACRVLLGKETEKETTFARTWRIETRKQRSLVALS